MSSQIDFTAIIFLVVAVIAFLKLRSVLGRRTGDEQARLERYKSQRAAQEQQAANDKVVTLPRRDREPAVTAPAPLEAASDREQRIARFSGGNAAIAKGLVDISRADRAFEPEEFLKGARAAYEMIVMAFAEGNRPLLKDLLGGEVYERFAQAIADREQRRETIEQSFVSITGAEIVEAEVVGGQAQVTIRFGSELINATRSAAGEVVAGDAKKIKDVTDVWTFAREVASPNPNWKLIATEGAS